jgi:hypothetical protein
MSDDDLPTFRDIIGSMPGLADRLREDIDHPGVVCAHCGFQQRGSATVDDQPVCHPNGDIFPDCYRLVTVMREPLGIRARLTAGADSLPVGLAVGVDGEPFIGSVVPVSRGFAIGEGLIDPTPAERAEMDREDAELEAKVEAQRPVYEAAVAALAALEDPLVQQVLDMHMRSTGGFCIACDGDDRIVHWPCETTLLIAEHHGITFPPGRFT